MKASPRSRSADGMLLSLSLYLKAGAENHIELLSHEHEAEPE
jgi:hypothetical protein